MKKDKYYYVRSKRLADAILWVSGMTYYTNNDNIYKGMKIFSFEDNEKFRNTLNDLIKLKNKYNIN